MPSQQIKSISLSFELVVALNFHSGVLYIRLGFRLRTALGEYESQCCDPAFPLQ